MTRADWTDTVIEVLFTEAVQAGFHFFLCLANTSENKTKPFHGVIIGPRESYQLWGARASFYLSANEVCKEWSFRGVHTAAPILRKKEIELLILPVNMLETSQRSSLCGAVNISSKSILAGSLMGWTAKRKNTLQTATVSARVRTEDLPRVKRTW